MVASALAINFITSTLNPVVFSFFIGPMSEELGVGTSTLSWSFTLRLIAAGVSGPALGILIDRHGARWVGALCGALAGATLIALSFAHQLWLVYLIFLISGFAGFGGPAGQLITQVPLAKWFEAQRGRAISIATTGMAGGTVVAIPVTQALIVALGWRTTYAIYGVVFAVVVVAVSLLFVRRSPEDMGLRPDGATDATAATRRPVSRHLVTSEDWTVGEAMRTPAMWLTLAAIALAGLGITGTIVHRVHYWEEVGMSPTLVGLGTATDPLAVVFSVFAVGLIADRVHVRYLGALGLAGLACSAVPLILTSGQAWTIVAHGLIWGGSVGGWAALNNLIWPNYFGRRYVGSIRGIVLPVSIITAGIGAPLYGYLLDSGVDPSRVWFVSVASFGAAALLVFFARPPVRPPRSGGPPKLASDVLPAPGPAGVALRGEVSAGA